MIIVSSHASERTKIKPASSVSVTRVECAEVEAIIARINEINSMDRSSLAAPERKALRQELRTIKRTAHDHGHGGVVYVSGGLVLLIVLLIILL